MEESNPAETGRGPEAGEPAADLAEVWDALDSLPTARAGGDLAATTVDLVAAKLAGVAGPDGRDSAGFAAWGFRVAAVCVALAAGLVAGRATAPDEDLRNLPLIEHLELLQEAGSVGFLESLARQSESGGGQTVRWFRMLRDPQSLRDEARDFDARIERLRADLTAGDDAASLVGRRARIERLPRDDLAALERAAETFAGLEPRARTDLQELARAVTDREDPRLRDAARLWHVIVAHTPPLIRQDVVDMKPELRLEWLQKPPGGEWRGGYQGRPRDDRGGDRRLPPDVRPGPEGPPPVEPRRPGPPRPWGDRAGEGFSRPPFNPGPVVPPPAVDPPAAPGETRPARD